MLAVGEIAPEFSGTTQDGAPLSLAALRGRRVVLYFYPKANTTGCTLETKGFATLYPDLQRAGVALVGVSVDSVESQHGFAEKCHAEFPLVADADRSIARAYGVLGLLGLAKRVTFFLGPDGRVEERVEGMLPRAHLERARARLGAGAGPTS
ncbi:MAG TPA: peroxiredoxin [Thermoplasmata archaeon]|nr:peroxiredoxin [Thermoplasmata archaeon]